MVDGGDDVTRIIKYFIISTQKKGKKTQLVFVWRWRNHLNETNVINESKWL